MRMRSKSVAYICFVNNMIGGFPQDHTGIVKAKLAYLYRKLYQISAQSGKGSLTYS